MGINLTLFATKRLTDSQLLDIVELDSLSPIVYPDNYQNIKKSMQQRGMDFPIVVLDTTIGGWRGIVATDSSGELLHPDDRETDEHSYLVMCGNNRLQAAKELGYDHIECIVCKTRGEVHRWATMMRKQWT